jgi:RNA-directed DNA polymerase
LEGLINGTSRFQRANKIHFVRYADDFIVTASTKEVLEDIIKPKIERFLTERGVALSPEKTKITHITDGFDFLGQNIRKHKTENGLGKIQIKPSNDSLKRMKTKISAICKTSNGLSQLALIEQLNPVLRGWANYHRHSICSKAFGEIDSHVFSRLFRWARRRHPDKTGQWIGDRYFSHRFKRRWTFEDKPTGKQLIRIARYFKFQRHIKVIAQANPFDPEWDDYFKQRNRKQVKKSSFGLRAKVLKHCCWICRVCWQPIQSDDKLDLHHIDGDHLNDKLDNLQLLHPNCHRQLHHR